MVDNHKNLKAIEGTDELTHKWADLFFDYNAYEEKLRYLVTYLVALPTVANHQVLQSAIIELFSSQNATYRMLYITN
jgi:hypothetical protein